MSGTRSACRDRVKVLRLAGRRHRAGIEVGLVVLVYFVYDSSRGILGDGRRLAVQHAARVFDLERAVHLNVETHLQTVSAAFPGLIDAFNVGYVTLHLGATITALIWLYRRQLHWGYVRLRTALVAASCVALLGFALLPTAPPRLTGIGLADTVSRGTVNLNSASLHLLYNPYAALPSVHTAYATLVGLALFTYGRGRGARFLGIAYPVWVAVEVMATGNHFLVDVIAGALLATATWWAAKHIAGAPVAKLRSLGACPKCELPAADETSAAA